MEILVEPVSGEPFIVCVNRYLTVFSLKLKLQRLIGLPPSHMVLVYNHQQLGDDHMLSDYGITTGARVQLLVTMKGGPVHAKRITLATVQDDYARNSNYDPEEEYYNRLTILLVDGENLNVIQMGADPADWDTSGLAEHWEDLVQQYESLQAKRRESFSAETNRLRKKVDQLKQKMQKKKRNSNLNQDPPRPLLPDPNFSEISGNSIKPLNPITFRHSNSYYNPEADSLRELPCINSRAFESCNKENETLTKRVPLTLPSIQPADDPPPKKKPRCTVCNRKLRIASAFSCKCKKQFCSKHRYAETHACEYNYKEEERKILAKNNPLVVAPKLPKI